MVNGTSTQARKMICVPHLTARARVPAWHMITVENDSLGFRALTEARSGINFILDDYLYGRFAHVVGRTHDVTVSTSIGD